MLRWLRPSSLRSSIGNGLANEILIKLHQVWIERALMNHIISACSYLVPSDQGFHHVVRVSSQALPGAGRPRILSIQPFLAPKAWKLKPIDPFTSLSSLDFGGPEV